MCWVRLVKVLLNLFHCFLAYAVVIVVGDFSNSVSFNF